MKLYAPKYYKKFKCIADRCEHSCCIGWEIDVDGATLERYGALKYGYGSVINDSISMEDTPHFKLGAGERCPHLDECGLCRIIINLGEDYLCDICREHPRFYNFTDVVEVGIGISCPEAARIVLGAPDYAELEEVGEVEAEADGADFDGRGERTKVYEILRTKSRGYAEKLNELYRTYSIDAGDDARWLKILGSLEYLDAGHKKLFESYSSKSRPEGKDEYLERFLAYFVYRHCTEAFDEADFCARLSFCLFCERLFASLICSEKAEAFEAVAELARVISEEIEYSDENTLALTR